MKIIWRNPTWGRRLQVTSPKVHVSECSFGRSMAWHDCARELSMNCPRRGIVKGRWYGVRARVVTLTLTVGTCEPLIPRFIRIQLRLMQRVISFRAVITFRNKSYRRSNYFEIK